MARLEETMSDMDMIYGGSLFSAIGTALAAYTTLGHEPNVGTAVGAMGIIFGGYFVYRGAVGRWGYYISLDEKEKVMEDDQRKEESS